MSFFDIFRNKEPVTLSNSEPNTVHEIGIDDIYENTDCESVDWFESMPDLVIPSIRNLRICAKTPTVQGILMDLIIKSISGYVITGDNQKAVDYIIEQDKRWNLKDLMFNVSYNNFVDGIDFYERSIDNSELNIRELAFDGDNYRMKELYDDTGNNIIGYVQWVGINQNTNKGFIAKKVQKLKNNTDYFQIYENKEYYTVKFSPDDITAPCFFRMKGKPYAIVRGILDTSYELEQIKQQMPSIVFKQANTMVVTVGNENRKEFKLDDDASDKIANQFADYHKKGIVQVPYGVEPEMIGETVLPKLQDYISSLKSQIYEGLITPEAIFSSSSSNRSTAVVQLDSDKSGRVLMQEFIQEKLSRWIEQDIIDVQLELGGYEKGSVWIEFNVMPEENTGAYNEDGANITVTTTTETNKTENDLINVTPTTGTNMNNIRNAEGRLNG